MLQKLTYRLTPFFSLSHSIEPINQPYLHLRNQQFLASFSHTQSEPFYGFYSQEGSKKYSQKHPQIQMKSLITDRLTKISSIGIGTYKGSLDDEDDLVQWNAVVDSVMLGSNMIDTCNNFRGGRSEMVVGAALDYLFKVKGYTRAEVMLATKAGYVGQSISQNYKKEVVNDHCVHPLYLEECLNRSLETLRVQGVDVFYVNNFAESQLEKLGKQKFKEQLYKVFEFCEKSRSDKKIQYYGMASWQSFRLPPSHPLHLNLKTICKMAEKVGGPNNGFKFLQTPISIMMPEAFAQKNQEFGSLLQTAEALKINTVSCSSLLNGTLVNIPLPSNKLICRSNGAKHLQLIRSVPSPALVCSLIGQKKNRHVKKNLQVLKVPSLNEEEWFNIFVPQEAPNEIPAE